MNGLKEEDLKDYLSNDELNAVRFITLFLSAYHSKDGSGLFKGVMRYNYLASRLQMAAMVSNTLLDCWEKTRTKLCLLGQERKNTIFLLEAIKIENQRMVLNILATKTEAMISLARELYAHNKEVKYQNYLARMTEEETLEFDDKLEE